MPFSRNTDLIYADGPASSPTQPYKPDIRVVMKEIERSIDAYSSGSGSIAKQTLQQLFADLNHQGDTTAWVYASSDPSENGIYRKIGGAGSGSWTRILPLPYSFIIANASSGSANAIRATTSMPVTNNALVWMTIAVTNTSTPVTVQFNGGATYTVKTNMGYDVDPGGLRQGMVAMGIIIGTNFRLLTDNIAASLLSQMESFVSDADAAASLATAARDISVNNANSAIAASQAATAAASQAQDLVEAATAGFVGFQPGQAYDFGFVSDATTYFDQDWGLITDPV